MENQKGIDGIWMVGFIRILFQITAHATKSCLKNLILRCPQSRWICKARCPRSQIKIIKILKIHLIFLIKLHTHILYSAWEVHFNKRTQSGHIQPRVRVLSDLPHVISLYWFSISSFLEFFNLRTVVMPRIHQRKPNAARNPQKIETRCRWKQTHNAGIA